MLILVLGIIVAFPVGRILSNHWFEIAFMLHSAKTCSVPPDPPPDGGNVRVMSDGYMYGHNCSTDSGGGYEIVPGTGGCETKLNMERTDVVGDFREIVQQSP